MHNKWTNKQICINSKKLQNEKYKKLNKRLNFKTNNFTCKQYICPKMMDKKRVF